MVSSRSVDVRAAHQKRNVARRRYRQAQSSRVCRSVNGAVFRSDVTEAIVLNGNMLSTCILLL